MSEKFLIHYEDANGRKADFLPHDSNQLDIEPLTFEHLASVATGENQSFPLRILNASSPTEQTGLAIAGPLSVSMNVTLHADLGIYGIVPGGWLPLPFASKKIALLDRNVFIRLGKLRSQLENDDLDSPSSWLYRRIGLDSEIVSPILFAIEGKNQRAPTNIEMREELIRAGHNLSIGLPHAKVQHVNMQQRKALRNFLFEHETLLNARRKFLIEISPKLVDPAKPNARLKREQEVFLHAATHKLRRTDLVVIAAISCIYDSSPELPSHKIYRPGRAIIKPKPKYTSKMSYNAVADIFSLEILINSYALLNNCDTVIYTEDQGLVAFWTALKPSEFRSENFSLNKGRAIVKITMTSALTPALNEDERVALAGRLESS